MSKSTFPFCPADWRKDSKLASCSLAARGLWIDLICLCHESATYGVLERAGSPITTDQIARMVGEDPFDVSNLLAELAAAGVFSRKANGAIFSRRMVRDHARREMRARAGRLGGNPALVKKRLKSAEPETEPS